MKSMKILVVLVITGLLSGCSEDNGPKTALKAKEIAIGLYSKEAPSTPVSNEIVEEVNHTPSQTLQPRKEEIEKEQEGFDELPPGVQLILDPSHILVPVNKTNALPASYTPSNLVAPNIPFSFGADIPKRYMREDAALAIEKLFTAAKQDGIKLVAISGYRSYSRQKDIFQAKARKVGIEKANQAVAYPGQSEHQTGLAMDVSSASMNYQLEQEFGTLKEGIWLAENAHRFGFIIRYLEGKEDITGYQYEPWHIRYVGIDAATLIYENQWTLEEYHNHSNKP